MVQRVKRAVIPVAGLGTRMLPATKAIPKELLPIFDRPIIEHVVNEAISGGITEIILVTRSGKEAVENYGVVDLDGLEAELFESVKIKGLVEKPSPEYAPANLAVVGRYVLPAKILDLLENMDAGVGREIQLTDALDKLLMIEGVNAFETDANSFDCGNKRGFLVANFAFGMRDPVTNTYMKEFIRCWDIEVSAMLTNFKYIIGVGKSEI